MLLCCVGEVRVLCRRVPGAECRWEGTTGEFTSAELAVCVLCVMLLAFLCLGAHAQARYTVVCLCVCVSVCVCRLLQLLKDQ